MKLYLVLTLAVLVAGCSSFAADKNCELVPSQLEILKPRALNYLDAEWQPEGSACEEISDSTQFVRDFGCGIYGMPAGSSRLGCPDALDGDYFVIFDPASLEPTEVVLIAY